tara:strand:- start:121 stop:399 length:279 start_codon:yes stop_codon:yes gene_type:complete
LCFKYFKKISLLLKFYESRWPIDKAKKQDHKTDKFTDFYQTKNLLTNRCICSFCKIKINIKVIPKSSLAFSGYHPNVASLSLWAIQAKKTIF